MNIFYQKRFIIPLSSFLLSGVLFSKDSLAQCPIPSTKTMPEVIVKVTSDKGMYTYSYTVKNGRESLLPIDSFKLRVEERPSEILEPPKWLGSFDEDPNRISWITPAKGITPGSSQEFLVKSSRSPGFVRYYVDGRTGVPQAVTINGDPEAFPDCPGFFFDKPLFESMTTGMTQGPVADNQVSVKVKVKKGKSGHDRKKDRNEIRPYQESGLVTVVVKGSKEFDVTDIDVSTMRFGMGKASPVWHELRPGKDDEDHDDDKHEKMHQKLWLQFDLDKIDIECDRDRVLFLEGKTKDSKKTVLGGVPVKALDCNKTPTNPRRKKEWEKRREFWEKAKSQPKSKRHEH